MGIPIVNPSYSVFKQPPFSISDTTAHLVTCGPGKNYYLLWFLNIGTISSDTGPTLNARLSSACFSSWLAIDSVLLHSKSHD